MPTHEIGVYVQHSMDCSTIAKWTKSPGVSFSKLKMTPSKEAYDAYCVYVAWSGRTPVSHKMFVQWLCKPLPTNPGCYVIRKASGSWLAHLAIDDALIVPRVVDEV